MVAANRKVAVEGFSLGEAMSDFRSEERILGSLMLDPECFDLISGDLKPSAFYYPTNEIIYQCIVKIQEDRLVPDLCTVLSYLDRINETEHCGGEARLFEMIESTVSSANVDQFVILVNDMAKRREMQKASRECLHLASNPALDVKTVQMEIEAKILGLAQEPNGLGLVSISDSLITTFSNIEARSQGLGGSAFLTGFYDFDALTQGFHCSDLITFAARPAMGKTAKLLCCARNIAYQYKKAIPFFSLEMSKEQLINRLLSMESGIDSNIIRSGRLAAHQWEPLGHAIAALSALPIFIDDTPASQLTLTELKRKLNRLKADHGELGPMFLDYLQLMSGAGEENRTQEISTITRGLKELAREFNIPVVIGSQLSRGVEGRSNKRPMLSDLRESGSIEQDSDLVAMLYRDEYYDSGSADHGIAEIILSKHRSGPIGTVKELFNAPSTQFLNMTPQRT